MPKRPILSDVAALTAALFTLEVRPGKTATPRPFRKLDFRQIDHPMVRSTLESTLRPFGLQIDAGPLPYDPSSLLAIATGLLFERCGWRDARVRFDEHAGLHVRATGTDDFGRLHRFATHLLAIPGVEEVEVAYTTPEVKGRGNRSGGVRLSRLRPEDRRALLKAVDLLRARCSHVSVTFSLAWEEGA